MRAPPIETLQTRLEREARWANKHPLNRETHRWRKEYATMLKEQFSVEPFGSQLQVDDFLLDSTDELEEQGVLGPERADVMRRTFLGGGCSARSSPRHPLTGDQKVRSGSIDRKVCPNEECPHDKQSPLHR